ncbi:hypothetical protein GCM10025858_09660 [Alicyclobacillus sacchari]|nr:hypothetical protein GCM10025858_09660 [Alicyclobacillus sacchari]
MLNRADIVITLCGDARDKCPATPAHVRHLHWGCQDPAKASGTQEEIMAHFREVRDEIRDRVKTLITDVLGEYPSGDHTNG